MLISEDRHPKIIDFGNTSHPQFNGAQKFSGRSTLGWTAPEAMEEEGLATAEGDVWAFGMTALVCFMAVVPIFDPTVSSKELFTRKRPFKNTPRICGVQIRIFKGHLPERPDGQTTHFRMSENWWNTCCACWNHEPHARPQMSIVLKNIT